MKITIFALCSLFLLCATSNAQLASVQVNNPQPMQMYGQPQHASQHAMATESSLLSTSSYSYAKGEVPLAELGTIEYQTPLGDVARAYRKEHSTAAKATKVLDK